jgi:tetratricopeptide (TPR) repeat protein
MPEETRDPNAQMAQQLFNKGFAAFERGNLDIAIDLLLRCVEVSPGFTRARQFLRAAEIQKFKKGAAPSFLGGKVSELASLPAIVKATALLKTGKAEQALFEAEKILRQNPLNRKAVYLLVEAAEAAGQTEAAILTLKAVAEQQPDDNDIVKHLGDAYMKSGDFAKARDCYSKVLAGRPTGAEVLKLLKDAEASHSVESGGWEETVGEKDGYRKLMRDEEQAKKLDITAKAQTAAQDAETMIADMRARIAAEPANLNHYRALARLFSQQKRFGEAIAVLEQTKTINAADPELDRMLTAARVQEFGQRIEAQRARGDAAGAERLEQERNQFVFDDLVARVERYPNDLRLRYELGMQYFQNEYYDDAIQQLQLAQRAPKERADALFHLAKCFRAKGQADMAVMQLETALESLAFMDANRMRVLFELGELAEAAGDMEKAFAYYREVYGADIAYRDVGQKMERMYKLRQKK